MSSDLSHTEMREGQQVWVNTAKAQHVAIVMAFSANNASAVKVRYASTGGDAWVDRASISVDLPPRERRRPLAFQPTETLSDPLASTPTMAVVKKEAKHHQRGGRPKTGKQTTKTTPQNPRAPMKQVTWHQLAQRKLDETEAALSAGPNITQALSSRHQQWMCACTEPSSGKPSSVFSRSTIHELLGGLVTDPAPVMDHSANTLFQLGEQYIVGDVNPWCPCFSGDAGLVLSDFIVNNDQTCIPLFVECSSDPNLLRYHGPDAAGKYVYLGTYQRSAEPTGTMVELPLLYSDLGESTRWHLAHCYRCNPDNSTLYWASPSGQLMQASDDSLMPAHFAGAYQRYSQKWSSMDPAQRRTAAWTCMLQELGYVLYVVPVEFHHYDNNIYADLMQAGGSLNGLVSCDDLGPC